ncbi:MAG: DUF935 family protein [Fimbriimonadales bacterium]
MFKLFSRKKKDDRREGDSAPSVSRNVLQAYRYPGNSADPFARSLDFNIYDEMQCDPLIKAAVTVKKLGALSAPWRIVPSKTGEDAEYRAKFIQYVFDEMQSNISTVLFETLDAIVKGYSVQEIVFVRDEREFDGLMRIHAIKSKDPSLFGFEVDEFLNVTALTLNIPGETPRELPIDRFVLFSYNSRYGQPMGDSDLRPAYRHWKIKRELIQQWSEHLEKFASPTVMGKFQRGTPPEDQAALLDALHKIQRQSAVVYPNDIEVAMLNGDRAGESGYLEAIDYHNREIARAILGQTLTTEDSKRIGSLALGKVHLQVLIMQLAGLRKTLAEKVVNEQIIRPLIDLNFGSGPYPRFDFEEPELDVFRTGRVM